MQLNVPPDLETLINRRLSGGGYSSAEDVIRQALEAMEAGEVWAPEDHPKVTAQIEEGYLQAERGELASVEHTRAELNALKDQWRSSRG